MTGRSVLARKAVLFFILSGMAFFILGCQLRTVEKGKEISQPKRDLFDDAEAYRINNERDKANQAYEGYLALNPKGKKAAMALQRMADLAAEKGDDREALTLYRRVSVADTGYEGLSEVRYQIARILAVTGDVSGSSLEAEAWLALYPDDRRRAEVFLLLSDNEAAMGNRRAAFRYWLKALQEVGDESVLGAVVKKRVEEFIGSAGVDDLRAVSSETDNTGYGPFVYYRLARLLMDRGDLGEAGENISKLLNSSVESGWRDLAEELGEELKERLNTRMDAVGCLLPLSGAFAIYGHEVLMGMQLALMSDPGNYGPKSLELVIRDTEGNEETARNALEELAKTEKVMAIVGPLSRRTAMPAAEKAQDLGIPIITLTQKEGVTKAGDMVFRFFPTPSMEIDALLERAVGLLGISRFAVLFPENGYGRLLAGLFWEGVEARGGSITAVESYGEDETDFEDKIKKITGLYYPMPRSLLEKLRALVTPEEEEGIVFRGEQSPFVDFEALFIPDTAERIAMIAPQLVYHDVKPSVILGTSLWQSTRLLEQAGDYLQNVLIPSGFSDKLDTPLVRSFVEDYKKTYGSSPTLLSAVGYDSVRILRHLLCVEKIRTRKEFMKALVAISGFETLRGPASFDSGREIKQSPPLLTVSGGKFVVANTNGY